jgi:hypothetical protein
MFLLIYGSLRFESSLSPLVIESPAVSCHMIVVCSIPPSFLVSQLHVHRTHIIILRIFATQTMLPWQVITVSKVWQDEPRYLPSSPDDRRVLWNHNLHWLSNRSWKNDSIESMASRPSLSSLVDFSQLSSLPSPDSPFVEFLRFSF